MKKIVFIFGILFSGLVYCKPAEAGSVAGAFLWRSSYSETIDTQMLISSEGVLAFGGVFVSSAPNTIVGTGAGYIYIYNNQVWGPTMSTITAIDCTAYPAGAVAGPVVLGNGGGFLPIQLSSGLMYTKVGACKTNIFWDVVTRNPLVKPIRFN